MALVACPGCRQTVLSEASSCPHCGRPLLPDGRRIDYVTGERVPIPTRPAAQLARRPFRYPTRVGIGMMGAGSAAATLGSFLPWAGGSGMSRDGPITLAICLAMLVLAFAARSTESNIPRILVVIGAVACIAVVVLDASRLPGSGLGKVWSAGSGIVLIGAGTALVGGFLRER